MNEATDKAIAAVEAPPTKNDRTKHNAPKGRFGYRPREIKTSEVAPYNIQVDNRGKLYAHWQGSLRRLDILPTKVGFALAGPDDRQFRIFQRGGKWILRDLETEKDFEM